jgi:hypothetical protein
VLCGAQFERLSVNNGSRFENRSDARAAANLSSELMMTDKLTVAADDLGHQLAGAPRAGQKVLTVPGTMPRQTDFKQNLCADIKGISLHAAVRCDAGEALEELCRYITRPAQANEPVPCIAVGQVVLEHKRRSPHT